MKINQSNLKWNGTLKKGNKVEKIVLHHAEHPNCSVNDIHRWHLNNGWTGIGYHYFVRKDGSIWTGRPEDATGAHCIPANKNSLGICAEGSFMKETMSTAQKEAIKWLISNIKSRYGNLPIYGHKELDATNCPGTNYPLAELKNTQSSSTNKNYNATIVNINSYLMVRSAPGSNTEIGKIYNNERVKVIERNGDYKKVKYDTSSGALSKEGWVTGKYVKEDEIKPLQQQTLPSTTKNIYRIFHNGQQQGTAYANIDYILKEVKKGLEEGLNKIELIKK